MKIILVIPQLDRGIQKKVELDSLVKAENDIFGTMTEKERLISNRW